ncbi:DUF5684 domain-containing protein [Okibacterium fritillariae]|uniref:DUF5684 domain-containing protein n=1 Tax=Okibacterium fritillariae TaxID=123320 RepID=UPI0040555AC4
MFELMTTYDSDQVGAISTFYSASGLISYVLMVVALWPVFVKAGRPGWAALIPIFNIYTLVKVANRPGWWTILYFIPIVNIVIHILVALDIAAAFRRSAVFGVVGLWLFFIIGFLILGYGKSQYQGVPRGNQRPAVA